MTKIPFKTICGTAVVIAAMFLGYDSQIALLAVIALLGIEGYGIYDQKKTKETA